MAYVLTHRYEFKSQGSFEIKIVLRKLIHITQVSKDKVKTNKNIQNKNLVNNKVLLYNTENYIQYPMINHNGKKYFKNVHIHVTESLCCTAEINTTL